MEDSKEVKLKEWLAYKNLIEELEANGRTIQDVRTVDGTEGTSGQQA